MLKFISRPTTRAFLSVKEFERCGFTLSEVTRDLHANGPVGIMTDYEKKFYEQGMKINRCVACVKAEKE